MSDAANGESADTCLSSADDISPTFFRCLLTEDERQQRIAIDHILKLLQESFYFGQCELVRAHLPRIVMMATECPVAAVRDAFSEFLVKFRPVCVFFEQNNTFYCLVRSLYLVFVVIQGDRVVVDSLFTYCAPVSVLYVA